MNKIVVVSAAAAVSLVMPPATSSEAAAMAPAHTIVPDPIFAAIEAHRRACDINTQCVEVDFALHDDDPTKEPAAIAAGEATVAMFARARDLLKIQPTTTAGAGALLNHVCEGQQIVHEDWRFPDWAVDGEEYEGEEFHLAIMKHVADALGSTPAGDLAASDGERAADPMQHSSSSELDTSVCWRSNANSATSQVGSTMLRSG